MNPVQLSEVVEFLMIVLKVYEQYLVLIFSLMVAFSLIFGIRKIILGNHY